MPGDGFPRGGGRTGTAPSFPQRSAFVLQFAADAGPETGLFRGKIQHIASGEQAVFHSTDELWAFVRNVLLGADAALAAARDEDC